MALPFLPGNTFKDPTKTRFHVSHSLCYKNGYAIPKRPQAMIGGDPLQINQLTDADLDELANTRPTLTYGNPTKPAPVEFIPSFVAFDKKALKFHAYFKQTVHESPNEYYRIRDVRIFYYLEDDSISVVEPAIENSGIPQGKLIKRQKVPKNDFGDCWHWKDLNIGMDIAMYGKVFHIYDCDRWTEEHLRSQGIDLCPREECPPDPYIESRKQPLHAYTTPSSFDKLKQFLEMDRHVLRFYSVWDDRDSLFGEIRPHVIHYYLVDDTVEIREVHEQNDGRDPTPLLLCRQRIPKVPIPSNFPTVVMELSDEEVKEWLSPKDFALGKTVNIMGRRFLIYDMDKFTREFYQINFGVENSEPIQVKQTLAPPAQQELPPYNGFGSLEDSKQSCLSLIPQPPKKDLMRMLENDGKVLRFAAILNTSRPEDENRKFIISYYLSDDMISIYEPPQRNSGVIGGKFLERTRVPKPGCSVDNPEFYHPNDFSIGASVVVFNHNFVITDADMYVVKYMEEHSADFATETISSLRQRHGTALRETGAR
ncbi:hypothetical protein EMCRGX_G014996 [Ephydatia muelleri]